MIKNRLSTLIAERGLSITRVSKETKISRNTITSISQNDSEMIRLETINSLCTYLGITHCEFFDFEPTEFEFFVSINNISYKIFHAFFDPYGAVDEHFEINDLDIDVYMQVVEPGNINGYDLECSLVKPLKFPLSSSPQYIRGIEIEIDIQGTDQEIKTLREVYSKINPSFHTDIHLNLTNSVNVAMQAWIKEDFYNSVKNIDTNASGDFENLEDKFIHAISEYFFVRDLQLDILNQL